MKGKDALSWVSPLLQLLHGTRVESAAGNQSLFSGSAQGCTEADARVTVAAGAHNHTGGVD